MAEAKKKVAPKKEVATVQNGAVAVLDDELLAMVAGGDDFERDDLKIPFLQILQKNSPQVDEDTSKYVPGAKTGMILNTATKTLYSSEDGVIIIPCKYQREYTEWRSRDEGGGLVNNFLTDKSCTNGLELNEKRQWVTKDDNTIQEAGVYYVLVVDPVTFNYEQAVISMSSTQMRPSRDWNTLMRSFKFWNGGNILQGQKPYLGAYKLTTVKESKDEYTWFNWVPRRLDSSEVEGFSIPDNYIKNDKDEYIPYPVGTPELPGGVQMLKDAMAFAKAVEGGDVKVQEAEAPVEGEDAF